MNTEPENHGTDPTTQKIQGIPLLTQPAEAFLNPRQQLDYAEERRDLIKWLLQIGKDPARGEGYSVNTVKPRTYRMDQFYRWVWNEEDGYMPNVTAEHADRYFEELKLSEKSNVDKNNRIKALKMLFKWRSHRRGCEQWDSEVTFKREQTGPRDFLRKEERGKIRQASLEFGSVPSYNNLSRKERDRWKTHLAQKFGKPKNEVTADDWDRANDWKIPSLVYVSLDAGLRPCEVRRAEASWVDLENGELRIPEEESAKNRDNWTPVLTQKTQKVLKRWMRQRDAYEKYEDSSLLWLTREANPYGSSSLKYLLTRLAEEAGMDTENRGFHWYMIRHSTQPSTAEHFRCSRMLKILLH